jgi:D-proline reductase (dithiol) PrdB
MPSLDSLPEANRNNLLMMAVDVNSTSPFTIPRKPLKNARLAIVTSAGLHLRDDRPFKAGDPTFRRIPSDTAPGDIVQSHASIGFDRTAVIADINVVFPLDRLREMLSSGRIGAFAPTFYSFMGAQRDITRIKTETAPAVAALLKAEGVDVVLLTPT